MAVRLIPCRRVDDHTVTADIPETGLQHMAAYEPVDEADRKRLGYTDADQPAGDQTPPAETPAPESTHKPRRSAGGKNTEE
jgi:hypothetical protein